MTFEQLDLLIGEAVCPSIPEPVKEPIVEEELAPEKLEEFFETDVVEEVFEQLPVETEVMHSPKREEGLQFLVSHEELPAQDPVTESDLLSILSRNTMGGLDQGVEEVARPAPPISFISPSLVEESDVALKGLLVVILIPSSKEATKETNKES
jgi:hypothetical protein